MAFDLVIRNGILLSAHNCYKPLNGSVGIRDGRIEYFGEDSLSDQEAKESIDATGRIVMPGLINGHCHGDMTMARGIGDDLTLKEQNDRFNPHNWFFDVTTKEDRFVSRLQTYSEAILSGTTFILENAFWDMGDDAINAMKKVGIRGGIVMDIFPDFRDADSQRSVEELLAFKDSCLKNDIVPVMGGVLEENYNASVLRIQSERARQADCLLTSHLSETTWRKQALEEKFDSSSVKMLAEHHILDHHYIGSHGIYLTGEDIELLKLQDAKIVNTPQCEMKIADGIAPIPELVRAGVTVGLGTDGSMWNNSNDIFGEMKGLALLQTVSKGIRSISAEKILDMATIDGARVFGLEQDMGSLEPGKRADIILVDARQPHMAPIRIEHAANVVSAIVYCARGGDVTDVIIGGEHIVQGGKLLTIDVDEVLSKVSVASEKIGKFAKEVMN